MIFLSLAVTVIGKILLDWLVDVYSISLTTILCSILTTFDYNVGFVANVLLNICNSLNFIIRVLVIYNTNDKSNEFFFTAASLIIIIVFIACDSLYLTYIQEK